MIKPMIKGNVILKASDVVIKDKKYELIQLTYPFGPTEAHEYARVSQQLIRKAMQSPRTVFSGIDSCGSIDIEFDSMLCDSEP